MLPTTAGEEAESEPRRRFQKVWPVCLLIASSIAVVGELEEVIAVDHGRELEQRAAVVHPQPLERRVQAGGGGEEARVVLGVAVERPGEAFRAARRQARGRLGHEARVGVVDAAGAVALVQIAAEHDGEQQHEQRRQAEEDSFGAEGEASDALRP